MKSFLIFAGACLMLCSLTFADPPVLYLAPSQLPESQPAPILVRELARQSLLIAARDELGLYTKDGAMREWDNRADLPADAQGKPVLVMNVRKEKGGQAVQVTLSTVGPGSAKLFADSVSTPVENGWISVPLAMRASNRCRAGNTAIS